MQVRIIALAVVGLLVGGAFAQYGTGFEDPPYVTAPGGQVLSGQDNWYLPVQGGSEFKVFAYSDATGPITEENPQGGGQYIAGTNVLTPLNTRAQHAINWSNTGKWTIWYDMAGNYTGTSGNNIASFSPRPDIAGGDTRNSYIHLFSHGTNGTDPNTMEAFYATWLNGGQNYGSTGYGNSPGPAWDLLEFNHWYRFRTTLDFATNTFVKASVIDLQAGTGTTVDITGLGDYPGNWYMEGEGNGNAGAPQAFRVFAGGDSTYLNTSGWDNICIAPGAGTGDLNCDGVVNFDDINPFVLALSNPAGYHAAFPNCCIQSGDCNLDGAVSFADINPFVALLTGL